MRFTQFAFVFLAALPMVAEIGQPERSKIDALTGAKGAYTAAEDVYRVTFPRTDVKVTIEGVKAK